MTANVAYAEVVQFVFPPDTVINNTTVPFDSFVVSSIDSLPGWLDWECNQNHPACTYVTTPGELTRGCVRIFGTPPTSAVNVANYDSVLVQGTAWITILFAIPVATTIPISFQVRDTIVGLTDALNSSLQLQLTPNPVQGQVRLRFDLPRKGRVHVQVFRMDGKEVMHIEPVLYGPGPQELELKIPTELARGVYLLRLDTEDGLGATTRLVLE